MAAKKTAKKAKKATSRAIPKREAQERAPGRTRTELKKAIDEAVVKRLRVDKSKAVSFGRLLDACCKAQAGNLPAELVRERLLALVKDGKIIQADRGEFHFQHVG